MAVAAYNEWCISNNEMVFLPTPEKLHKCTSECNFFSFTDLISVCKSSRHVHTCTKSCGTLEIGPDILCGITRNRLQERQVNCYWDESQTLTQSSGKQSRKYSNKDKVTTIFHQLKGIFTSEHREKLEIKNNLRLFKKQKQNANKYARSMKLFRTDWHKYYFLFLKHCKRNHRIIPSNSSLLNLAKNICIFWEKIYGKTTFHTRKVIIFVATCIAELSTGNLPIFPKIPCLAKSFSSMQISETCNSCLGIASRSTTTMLSFIQSNLKQHHPTFIFPTSTL